MALEGINTSRRQHRGYDYAVDVTRLQGPSASYYLGMCTLAWAGLQEGESVGGTCSYCSGHTLGSRPLALLILPPQVLHISELTPSYLPSRSEICFPLSPSPPPRERLPRSLPLPHSPTLACLLVSRPQRWTNTLSTARHPFPSSLAGDVPLILQDPV